MNTHQIKLRAHMVELCDKAVRVFSNPDSTERQKRYAARVLTFAARRINAIDGR